MKKLFNAAKSIVGLLTTAVLLTGCGSITGSEMNPENVPTNTYTSQNGSYSVSLPGEWEVGDNMGLSGVLMLENDGVQALIFGMPKGQILGQAGADVDSLEEYFDYVEGTFFGAPAMSTALTDTESIALSGTLQTLAKEGTATQLSNGAKAQMFIECAETESSYYCFSFSVTRGYDKKIAPIKEHMTFEELGGTQAEELSDTLRWINASCAIVIRLNGGDLDIITGFEPNIMITSGMKTMLERDWDVTDADSLYDTIDWLMNEGHNQDGLSYLESLNLSGGSREEILASLQAEGASEEDITEIMAVYDAKSLYGDAAISGWDYSRAMSMLGWGYLAEYLTYEEAMDKSLELAQIIQPKFESWNDYNESYFYGYSYWSGNSREDTSSNAYQRYQIYEEIKEDENNIYTIDFKSELQKEW